MSLTLEQKDYLHKLVTDDRSQAYDNLARAKVASIGTDLDKEWGVSGQTLREIIDDYRARHALATATLRALRDLP